MLMKNILTKFSESLETRKLELQESGKAKKVMFIAVNVLTSLILLYLFFAPCGMSSIDLFDSSSEIQFFNLYKIPFYEDFINLKSTILYWCLYSVYFLPLNALFLILALFIKDNLRKSLYLTTLICLTIYIFSCVTNLIVCANSARWFVNLPWYVYLNFSFAFVVHAVLSFYGIHWLRMNNQSYAEYKEIQSENKTTRISVKTKILLAFVISISVILFSFMVTILNGYKKMITEAVSDVGKTQAEQTASVYDSAEGKYEKIASYFRAQKKTNSYAGTPYERIDIIITSSSTNVYLEDIDSETDLPGFGVFAYTTGVPSKISGREKVITSVQAHEYIKNYQTGNYRKTPVYDKENKTCKYIYPVTLAKKAGHKLVGFSLVTYKEEVLMRQYFKTKVFVISCVGIVLYLSVLFSLFLADIVINPLLYLRANVRKTSNLIADMLEGSARDASFSLDFKDDIKTHDEIKGLSEEIKDMVTLIKGIVPYISTSTLQHAEKESKRSTTSRDLCFLFTDIRNFTSLCEGMPPKKIVELLNHYLDIETEIIIKNGGDIDKYAGDEMMAFFAGPKKEINACKAAMEIRQAMRAQQEISISEGSTFVTMGIGIHSGKVVFGSIGSKTRKDFTSIGDTVNLAARLEGANKAYGSKTIITETVYEKLKDTFICRELDFITVKGKTKPVRIYEILQETKNAADKLVEIKKYFEKGLALYRLQKWDESLKFFTECAQKYNDMPSVVFMDRIQHFKTNPPAKNWDGVFKMEVK